MGLVRKTSIESYWNHGEIVRTPYFGTYMSQNNFQNILLNFHVVDNSLEVPRNRPGHDPLFHVKPMIGMMGRTFKQSYKAGRDLNVDEGCMPFWGRVKYRCYNPSNPAKYHIKLFEVNDAWTGFCLALMFTQANDIQLDVYKMCNYLILHVTKHKTCYGSYGYHRASWKRPPCLHG